MRPYKTALAILLVGVLGFAGTALAAERGGHAGGVAAAHGGATHASPGAFHGNPGQFHGRPGAFHGRPEFHGHDFHAHDHGHVVIGVSPFVFAPGYVYAPPVYAPPVYDPAPVYAPDANGYWYYCPSAGAYYPTVPTCSD